MSRDKLLALSSQGNVILVTMSENIPSERILLATSSGGCRAMAQALREMADEIDKLKDR